MNRLLTPLAVLVSFLCTSAVAGDFARVLPVDTLIYVESRNIPALVEKYEESALWKSIQEFDWKAATLFFVHLAELDEDMDLELEAEDLMPVLDKIESAYGTLESHLSGDWVFRVSGLKNVIDIFAENEELRAEFFLNEVLEEDLEEDDPELLAQLEREAELDATEMAALLGTVSFLADVNDGDELEETLKGWVTELQPHLADMDTDLRFSSSEFSGTTIHALSIHVSENVPAMGVYWFIQDGVWAMAFTQAQIEELAGFLTTPPQTPLASQPDFQEAVRIMGEIDSFTYVDLPALDRILRDALTKAEDLPSAGTLTPEGLVNWLGLNALLPFTQGTLLEEDGLRSYARLGFTRETALSRMFYDEEAGPLPTPSFLHKDVAQFSVGNWHVGRFWTRMEQEIMPLAPEAAAGLGMARMLATGQLGFDIKLQFFDHLDSGAVYIQEIDPEVMARMQAAMATEDPAAILEVSAEHPTSGQNYLIALEMKNEDAIREAIDRLMMRFFPEGAPEPKTVEGIEVMNPIPPGLAGGMFDDFLHISFLDGWLVMTLGDPSLLEDAIAASNDESLQIWQDSEFQSLRASLPTEATGLQYTSSSMQQDAIQMMTSSFTMLANDKDVEVPDFSPFIDYLDSALQATTRDGLVVEIETFTRFQD